MMAERKLEVRSLDENQKGGMLVEKEGASLLTGGLAAVKEFMSKKFIPAVLEGGVKAHRAFETALDGVEGAINAVLPASSQMLTGFVLPSHAARIADKLVEYGTKGGTAVAKIFAKGAASLFTFGAPAWLEAFRQHYAVSQADQAVLGQQKSSDVRTEAYLEHLQDEKLRESFREYCSLRTELQQLRLDPEKHADRLRELSAQLAEYEVRYKDVSDFATFKSLLELGGDFFKTNKLFAKQLAEETAARMIKEVEGFYGKELGALGSKVEGDWSGLMTSEKEGRIKLEAAITERLHRVFVDEMNDQGVQEELSSAYGALVSGFGVYRKYLKASIQALLRFIPIPTFAGEAAFVDELSESVSRGLASGQGVEVPAQDIATSMHMDGYKFFPSLEEYAGFAGRLSIEAVGDAVEALTRQGTESILQLRDWFVDGLRGYVHAGRDAIKEWAQEEVRRVVGEATAPLEEARDSVMETLSPILEAPAAFISEASSPSVVTAAPLGPGAMAGAYVAERAVENAVNDPVLSAFTVRPEDTTMTQVVKVLGNTVVETTPVGTAIRGVQFVRGLLTGW